MMTAIASNQCDLRFNSGGDAIICGLSLLLVLAHADWDACSLLFSSLPPLDGLKKRECSKPMAERDSSLDVPFSHPRENISKFQFDPQWLTRNHLEGV